MNERAAMDAINVAMDALETAAIEIQALTEYVETLELENDVLASDIAEMNEIIDG